MADLHLYSYQSCPFARRTRMTLIEKGLDFALTEIDVRNKPDNFNEISPYGKVPVLLHNGGRIYESAIINEYLDEVFPQPPLMPADPFSKAQARIWMDYCDSRFSDASWRYIRAAGDQEKLPQAIAGLEDCFRFIETGLRECGSGPYWLGAGISLVDIQFMPFFQHYAQGPGFELIPDECTRLRAWVAFMRDRDSYMRTAALAA